MRTGTSAEQAKDNDAGLAALAQSIKAWGRELGLGAVAIAATDMAEPAARLDAWLAAGRHGEMDYMARHAALRADPSTLLPGAVRAIVARLDYRPREDRGDWIAREEGRLRDRDAAVISVYARGRDYHKVLRDRLQKLATRIEQAIATRIEPAVETRIEQALETPIGQTIATRPGQASGVFRYRVCTDSAPVFEIEAARRAGIGWRGKHTLLLSREAGSMFFLGEILTDLELPVDAQVDDHCGTCTGCIDVCPTRAITAPFQLDARRCISYLTIEHRSSIPESLRAAIGNRVYGCDDCQLVCPWNKYAQVASVADFDVRNGLDRATLVELFAWTEDEFRTRHAGSAILRIGYERWLRNIAVGLGNAETSVEVVNALRARADHPSALVREHVAWALSRHAVHPLPRSAGGGGGVS